MARSIYRSSAQVVAVSLLAGLIFVSNPAEKAESVVVTSCAGAGFLQNGGFESGGASWRTTDHSDNTWFWHSGNGGIEIWSGRTAQPNSTARFDSPGNSYTFEGGSIAELQAEGPGALYQDISTVPGTVIRWSFRHHNRAGSAQTQNASAQIGPVPSDRNIPSGRNGNGRWTQAENNNRWSTVTPVTSTSSVGPDDGWRLTSGTYTVPDGQTTTRFMFGTNDSGASGNLLDAITFTPILACPVTGPTLIAGRSRSRTLVNNTENASVFDYYSPSGSTASIQAADMGITATASASTITTLATNSGSYSVTYGITNGSDFSESTISYQVLPEATVVVPTVIPVDPRVSTVTLPAVPVGEATNAYICVDQVASSTGAAISTPTYSVTVSRATAGVNTSVSGTTTRFAGSATNVGDQIGGITLQSASGPLANGQSRFIRIRVSSTDDNLPGDCSNGISRVVEIRPYGLEVISNYSIRLRD